MPPGRPENDTVTFARGARAAAAETVEAEGLAEGEGDAAAVAGDPTGADASGVALEHDAAAASDRAANPIASAVRASATRDMNLPLVAAARE